MIVELFSFLLDLTALLKVKGLYQRGVQSKLRANLLCKSLR
jgi:hypothetical protein